MPCQSMISPPLFASFTSRERIVLFFAAASASPQMSACRASLSESSMYPSSFDTSTTFAAIESPTDTFRRMSRAFMYSRPKIRPAPKGCRSIVTRARPIADTVPSITSPSCGAAGLASTYVCIAFDAIVVSDIFKYVCIRRHASVQP